MDGDNALRSKEEDQGWGFDSVASYKLEDSFGEPCLDPRQRLATNGSTGFSNPNDFRLPAEISSASRVLKFLRSERSGIKLTIRQLGIDTFRFNVQET